MQNDELADYSSYLQFHVINCK